MRSQKRTLFSSLGASLLFAMTSCGGGGSGGGTPPPPPAGSIYVLGNLLYPEIFQFSQTATGAAAPTATITGAENDYFEGLATDEKGNIYVGDAASDNSMEILIFPPGSKGIPNPAVTISTQLVDGIMSLEVDSAGNVYAGSPEPGVYVYSPMANGHYALSRSIAGSATTIANPVQMAIDSANNLFVANAAVPSLGQDSILIFNSAANGNVAPTSTIGGPKTMINYVQGVAVDGAGNIYVAAGVNSGPTNYEQNILEFSAGSAGNVAPIRTIGGPSVNSGRCEGLRLDSSGNIYVLNDKILKFAASASGNASPMSEIDENLNIPNESFDVESSIALH